ncbi:hypothetical protein K1719_016904 [Acacia pycnantha]|nr:hypothetical protein K1719_016904 [Acacia pycnantha]
MIETRRSHFILLFLLLATTYVSGGAIPHSATAPSPSSMTPEVDISILLKATAVVCAVLFITFFSAYFNYWTAVIFARQHDLAPAGRNGVSWRCSCSRGIDRKILDTFPILVYSTIKNQKIGKGELECAVCLSEFEDHQTLRLIPKCNHVFHPECIGAWLASHDTCPLCRANLNPDPGEVSIRMPTQLNADEPNEESGGRSMRSEVSERQNHPAAQVPNDVGASSSNSANNMEEECRAKPSRNRRTRWGKYERLQRSNSTGHSLVEQPEATPSSDHERYTLRLPEELWRYILMNHAAIGRSESYHGVTPMKGMGWSDSDESSRGKVNLTMPPFVRRKD